MRTKDAPIATRVVKYEAGKSGSRSDLIVTTSSVRLPSNRMFHGRSSLAWYRNARVCGLEVAVILVHQETNKLSGGNSTRRTLLEEATRKEIVMNLPIALTTSITRKKIEEADKTKSDGAAEWISVSCRWKRWSLEVAENNATIKKMMMILCQSYLIPRGV